MTLINQSLLTSPIVQHATELRESRDDVDSYATSQRKMTAVSMAVYISECLRRRRFPATIAMVHRDLENEFGVTVCLRTVRRYLQLLELFGCAEAFPADGDFPMTWGWTKGLGLLSLLDREATSA